MTRSERRNQPQLTLAVAEPVVDFVTVYAIRKRRAAALSALPLLALLDLPRPRLP
jgi:hypothetical protein